MKTLLYIYQTGERPDGFWYAVAGSHPDGGAATDLALFVDQVDAQLYAYDKAHRIGADVLIMPSAAFGTNAFGWPLSLVRADEASLRRGEVTPMCPQCSSYDCFVSIKPAGYGIGPGRIWRMGDAGGVQFIHCNECGHENERIR